MHMVTVNAMVSAWESQSVYVVQVDHTPIAYHREGYENIIEPFLAYNKDASDHSCKSCDECETSERDCHRNNSTPRRVAAASHVEDVSIKNFLDIDTKT